MSSRNNKQSKISLMEIDDMFNDVEFCHAVQDTFKRQSSTVRHDTKTMFYQKPTVTQVLRLRAKGSHAGTGGHTRCPSIKKEERKHRWASLISEGKTEHHKHIPSEIEMLPIIMQYEQSSFLCRECERLINNLNELPHSMKMMLYTNQHEVQRAKMSEQRCSVDDKFLFIMFNTLQQLDKQILEPLHATTSRPVLNFKLNIVQNAMNLTQEIMVQSVREALKHDTRLGIFMEGFCKFWVVLIDIQLQWMGKSCADYIDAQVKEFKQQFNEAVAQKLKVEDQMIQMEKEFRAMEAQLNRKHESLTQQLLSVQQEFQDYKVTVSQMSDLRIAEERMNSVGLKALELESTFKQYDKVVSQHSMLFHKDIKELGNAILQQKKSTKPPPMKHQEAQMKLGCHRVPDENYQPTNINSVGIFMQLHPFAVVFEVNKELEMDFPSLLQNFLDYLIQLEDDLYSRNVCNIFIDWVGDTDKLNCILTYLSEADLEIPIIEMYCLLFGIREHRQLGASYLKDLLKYYKQLQEEHGFQLNEALVLRDAFPYLQALFPEEFLEKVSNTQKSSMPLIELLLKLAQYYHMNENKQWSGYFYKQEIEDPNLDPLMIKQFMEIRQQMNRQIDDTLKNIRVLSLLHPSLFYKPRQSAMEKMKASVRKVARKNSQRSPLKRSSTLIKAISMKK